MRALFALPPLAILSCFYACNTGDIASPAGNVGVPIVDASIVDGGSDDGSTIGDVHLSDAPPIANFCDLPGSVVWHDDGSTTTVAGGQPTDLAGWLKLPGGFCAHPYGKVGNARQVRFAPGGELFVASPTGYTTGGGSGGLAAIVVLPDDDRDGYADSVTHFADPIKHIMDALPQTQGMLFFGSWFYYQDGTKILRIPYQAHDRSPQGTPEELANITIYESQIHWPKVIDADESGNVFVGNGGDQGESCDPAHPFHGGIVKLDGTPNGHPYVRGFRNPIGLRCQHGTGKNLCFAVELARDYSWSMNGREKVTALHDGDDWGYPCCASKNLPFSDLPASTDCSNTVDESNGFVIGHTPFGVDFEIGRWPAPWGNRAYVVLHGAAGSWEGARMIALPLDGNGMPVRWSEISSDAGALQYDFATGWDDGHFKHGRPAALTFAPDGRLFLANDNDGSVIWIAPVVMPPPPSDAGADADAQSDAGTD